MRAVIARSPGGPEVLAVIDLPAPEHGPGDLLVDVAATAVNRADILQRQGAYPPPPGASDVLGLELSGVVAAVGAEVDGWSVGDPVCAVVASGGYAEQAVIPAATAMPLPPGTDPVTAAAVPEVFATAFDNLFVRGGLRHGEVALLHGGSSGVGTAGIQLADRAGATVVVTVGTADKAAACTDLGADHAINYREAEDWAAEVRDTVGGVDVLLDIIGAKYLAQNLSVLNVEGRMVVIGLMGGVTAEVNLGLVLSRRLTVRGSTLRARSVADKAVLAQQLVRQVWPGFADGSLRPVIHTTMPLGDAAEAHALMESSDHIGKIVLTT